MMFMRHISLCIILQLVHLIMRVHITYSVQTKTNYSDFFFIYFIQNAPLDRVGRKVKKKKIFFFLGSGPKIGSVGTWETDNQLDVP